MPGGDGDALAAAITKLFHLDKDARRNWAKMDGYTQNSISRWTGWRWSRSVGWKVCKQIAGGILGEDSGARSLRNVRAMRCFGTLSEAGEPRSLGTVRSPGAREFFDDVLASRLLPGVDVENADAISDVLNRIRRTSSSIASAWLSNSLKPEIHCSPCR